MTSSTEMANLALSHCAVSKNIGNLDTSVGPDAEACRRFFDIAMNTFQRDFQYAFATTTVTLGLIREDPDDRYSFEYTYPANCQFAGRLISGLIKDNRQSQFEYKIMRGDSGRVIWTNCEEAELEFQFIETDTGRYQVDFILAFTYKLAELIAPRVTGGDPFKLGNQAKANYQEAKNIAQANAMNEQQEEEEPESEFIRSMFSDPLRDRGQKWQPFGSGFTIL